MNKGQRRKNILDDCPDEFHDELESFINEIENEVNNIINELSITSISELGRIEEAYNLADDLADSLY